MTSSRRRSGFSLLEVVIAMTIVGITFSVSFAALSRSLRSIDRVGQVERRLQLARNKLAEIDLVPALRSGDQAAGSFDDRTRWRIETSTFIPPINDGNRINSNSVVRAVLTLEWESSSGTQTWRIESYKFVPGGPTPVPGLEEQLRELQSR